jgi:Rieske 2Fe-2S family protein
MITETQTWPTLPGHYYFDESRYEQELEQIWYRNWLYVCRSSALSKPRAFRLFSIGSQNIIILRDEVGVVQAFHNTCRHRGSILCTEPSGRLA